MVNTLPSQGNIHGFEPHTGHHLKRTQIIRCDYLFFYTYLYIILPNSTELNKNIILIKLEKKVHFIDIKEKNFIKIFHLVKENIHVLLKIN